MLGGLHIGLSSVYGVLLRQEGQVIAKTHRRFSSPEELGRAYDEVKGELEGQCEEKPLWTLALEKAQRLVLAPRNPVLVRGNNLPDVVKPALSAVLLGAIPSQPGLLLSLGKEVRFALIDSTLTYREYRINEAGGEWWRKEFTRLAEHSKRLRIHLKEYPDGVPPLKSIPRLLEMGLYPTPDPVLKPRLEKLAEKLAGMALTLVTRLPGIKRFALSGYLADSALGQLVVEELKASAPDLRRHKPSFPPEVGAALTALALERENWERAHLEKPLFHQNLTADEWAPPKELIRRLYRLRKPFEKYS